MIYLVQYFIGKSVYITTSLKEVQFMQNLTKKTPKFIIFIFCIVLSILLFACDNYSDNTYEKQDTVINGNTNDTNASDTHEDDIAPSYTHTTSNVLSPATDFVPSANTARSLNQNNNIQYWGFAVMVDDYIFLADGRGIHRTDRIFENVETLVFNESLREEPPQDSGVYLAVFSGLQYYDNKIYFLDRRSSTIYSMNLDGSDLTQVFNASEGGRLGGILLEDEQLFIQHINPSSLKLFNLETSEITSYEIEATFFSISPDSSELHFVDFELNFFGLNLKDGTIMLRKPLNLDYLIDKLDFFGFMPHRTVSGGRTFFASSNVSRGSRIFVINNDGFAEEIYFRRGRIAHYINSIDEWVYFTAMPLEENERYRFQHNLYRVKNDGSIVKLVYENLVSGTFGAPHIFINMFCEDIILFKSSPTSHDIFALIRNPDTGELERMHINPIT